MTSARILIVDDSIAFRTMLSELIRSEPGFEVAGTASNGVLALDRIGSLRPDAITLDVEMPEMDGPTTLAEIRKRWPRLPVVIVSGQSEASAAKTIEALGNGPSDYIMKPSGHGSRAAAIADIRQQLLPKLRALCATSAQEPEPEPATAAKTCTFVPSRRAAGQAQKIEIVAIGSSTGGPTALEDVLGVMPANFPVPILVTQHMPPLFTRLLAERLARKCPLKVHQAEEGAKIGPGEVWVAAGGSHMVVSRVAAGVVLNLNQDPPENFCRPAVDVTFRSVAAVYGGAALGVVLTGMGQDGANGSAAIRAAGGDVFTQDEASSVVWGMPGAVTRAGLASRVLPLNTIGQSIQRIVLERRLSSSPAPATPVRAPTGGGT